MAESLEQAFNCERNEKQEANTGNHREGKKTRSQKAGDAPSRFSFHFPNRVQRILELAENAARAKQSDRNPEHGGDCAFFRMRRLRRDVSHNIDRALIEKVPHLFGELLPCTGRIMAEDQADDREQQNDERRE